MAFEELLQHVGANGRFQVWTITIMMVLMILSASHDTIENFTAAIPAHHCHVRLLDNPKSETNITINLTAEALLRVSIPADPNQEPEQCRRFHQTQWQLLDPNVSAINNTEPETEPCLDGWIYDQNVFTSTIVTEWDLVCDYQSFKYFAQSISLLGYSVGCVLGGSISDRFGRKPPLVSSCIAYGILSICCAFAPVFSIYCTLRFLSSVCLSVTHINNLLFLLEGSSQKWHPAIATLYVLSISVGQALLAGLAYLFRDWHMLQLALALPYLIVSLPVCWFSESVRWLVTVGKIEEALIELRKIARINGNKEVAESLTPEILMSKIKEDLNTSREYFRVKDIIVNPAVLRTVVFTSMLGFSTIFINFGLIMDVQNVGKNIFLTQFLLAIVDFPSKLLTFFILRHANRRPSVSFAFLVFGGAILITIFVSKEMHVLRLILFLLGRAVSAIFLSILFTYSNELSPTVLRSTLQGLFTLIGRLAAALSVLVLSTRIYFVHLPAILYSICSITSSGLVYCLPETFNMPLIDTIKDMEKRYKLKNKSTRKKQRRDLLETTEC